MEQLLEKMVTISEGCILEADFGYPKGLHNLLQMILQLLKKNNNNKDMLFDYCLNNTEKLNVSISKIRKLVLNLYDKKQLCFALFLFETVFRFRDEIKTRFTEQQNLINQYC